MKFRLLTTILWVGSTTALMPAQPNPNITVSYEEMMRRIQAHAATTAPPRPQGCGYKGDDASKRLSPGAEAGEYAEFKWTVSIFTMNNNNKYKYYCVGSLIHPEVVLSAGHRFVDSAGRWSVRAADHYLKERIEPFEAESKVKEVIVHPNYNKDIHSNNIALLFLETPLPASETIGFICLPSPQAVTPPGTRCTVAGWGHTTATGGTETNELKMVELPIVENQQCERVLRPLTGLAFDVHKTQICAGGEKDKDTCKGDGGAALVCPYVTAPNRYYQVGITSHGHRCGLEGVPAVYTNVAELRIWIDQVMVARGYGTETYTVSP